MENAGRTVNKRRCLILTNKDIYRIAIEQTAIDSNCRPEDLKSEHNIAVISKPDDKARKYLKLPFFCDLVSYGSNVVASVDERIMDFVLEYINGRDAKRCFGTPDLHILTHEFRKYGKAPCFMAEYFLPDLNLLKELHCGYEIKILGPDDFSGMYVKEWSNALCENRKELDVIGAAAVEGGKIIALAGASADCDAMWQIGIDVLPEYRMRGIASALTSRLAIEIIKRGKVPFYCCAWSNLGSVRNAVTSGFRPAWIHLTSVDLTEADTIADSLKTADECQKT